MSLNDEERKTMVGLQLEKANRFLEQAEMVRNLQQWDLAANRYYYACFHAVQALFIHNGLASKTHAGMLRQFGFLYQDGNRRLGICEELGSGLDKAVAAIELFQLPPLRFTVQEARTTVTIFSYRKYADLDRQERVYACYQHACLKYVTNDKMTNLTLRERLGIDKQNYPMASRIIKDALNAGKIKEEKTENQSRNNKGYIPFWA